LPKPEPAPSARWAVKADALRRTVGAAELGFKTTEELQPGEALLGQSRALDAIRFACEMRHEGYNLFVFGPSATGKHSTVRAMLGQLAAEQPAPPDWVYVNNFAQADRPKAIEMPPGRAAEFARDMDDLIEDLSVALPAMFESDDYTGRRRAIDDDAEQAKEMAFQELRDRARAENIAILRTPMGFALAPMKNGEVIKPDVFNVLPKEEREAIEHKIEALQTVLEDILAQLPGLEKERRSKVRELNAEVAQLGVRSSIEQIAGKYADLAAVAAYLGEVETDLIGNVDLFLSADGATSENALPPTQGVTAREPRLRRYSVNVVVSKQADEPDGAPLVEETNPNLNNLTGRIEHISQMGALLTDFTLIKAGALHRANGGYLMLDARQILTEPYAWEALKRCLQAREIAITSLAEQMSLTSTVSLRPDPIPLSVKVILIGEPMLYYLLARLDPDFDKLFKVEAEFDSELDWTEENVRPFAGLVGGIARKFDLRPLDTGGVAEIISEAARMVGDNQRLSLAVGALGDLLREADHWSGVAGETEITVGSVRKAVEQRERRRGLIRERSQESVLRNIRLVDTDGEATGQVNGLSVLDLGRYRFGQPSRITARTRPGSGKVVDIEREVELGGPLHSKGMLILSSFLSSRFALEAPLSLWASLVFEQSYGGVDGDSASSAELYALLSSLSEVPIRQRYAVTGSVNQNGEVQAIGGVNEKIEGFFDICDKRGLTGEQGVMIPAANTQHLMLRPDVVEAVDKGRFHVFAVERIDDGIEILTGVAAGTRDADGNFPEGSINYLVEKKLVAWAELRRKAAESEKEEGGKS